MPDSKQGPVSRILIGAAATLVRPFASAAGAAFAAVAFFRGTRDPFVGASQSAALANVDTRKWSPPLLKQLEWRRFEQLCAAYFETLGFRTRTAPSAAGGGVDLHLIAGGSDKTSIVVHSKAWDAYRIGIKAAKELRSAMAAANAGEGVLVTSGRFTQEAVVFAAKENIQLIDGPDFLAKIAALVPEKALALLKFATQGDFLTPTCPSCSIKMISRRSTREGRKFWGCRNYPRCKHTVSGTLNAPA
jgi:restriction system protein